MRVVSYADMETLADKFLEDVFNADNFKDGFLGGANALVCDSKGLREYLRKRCVDKHGGIWALSFKTLADFLMQCAYNLSRHKKDEKRCVYDKSNIVWAIYNLLEEDKEFFKEKIKTSSEKFSFAAETASLFFAYQIYRPLLIEAWDKGKIYEIEYTDENFIANEKWQRELWNKLKARYPDEPNICELYKFIEKELKNAKYKSKFLPERFFVFAPASLPPVHLNTLKHLAQAGCKIDLYLFQISKEYTGAHLSDKQIAGKRKESWEKGKIVNEKELYWDLGNKLIANLGRNAQVFYEQILECGEYFEDGGETSNHRTEDREKKKTLLKKIKEDIINDEKGEKYEYEKYDFSLTINNCFSPLREIEVLSDYIIDLFVKNENLSPENIAVVSPNIEPYASAIETVFGRYGISYNIADRDVKKYDKTAQLFNLLLAQTGGRYEAPDVVALFEYSMFVQGKELDSDSRERLEKWIRENAVRHGLKSGTSGEKLPDYSFESGFNQLAAGFLMISKSGFSDKGEYCYPDMEGALAEIAGDFFCFIKGLKELEEESEKEKTINDWDSFFKKNWQIFFGTDETDFNEEDDPYQQVINEWDSLKQEMRTGFDKKQPLIAFCVIKNALLRKMESNTKNPYSLNGGISFSNIETTRAVPYRIICCIGMNGKEFPRQNKKKEISIIDAKYTLGDKDTANEDRLTFLETIISAEEKLYISWIGQDEKTADEIEPSSAITALLKNLREQYGIDTKSLVVKHPLQPFSRKYSHGALSTYDRRWDKTENTQKKSIWEWSIENIETEKKNGEERNIHGLFKILSDAPKYFLRTSCNIELPEEICLLQNLESFVVERGLDEWTLTDLILNNGNIEIAKLRGELPKGKFAEKIINRKTELVKEMEKMKDETVKSLFVIPGRARGKYRLLHWLKHLEHNKTVQESTDIILIDEKGEKPIKIRLPEISREKAECEINRLWKMADLLKTKMLPVFPDAAYNYCKSLKDDKEKEKSREERIKKAENEIFGGDYNKGMAKYCAYAKKIFENAVSFKDIDTKRDVESEFVECCEILFKNYDGESVQ